MPAPLDPDGVPNLDAMNDDELMTFCRTHTDGMEWRQLFHTDEADRFECERAQETARQLSLYAWHLYLSRNARLEGKVHSARSQEAFAQRIYNQLPEWARW